MTKAASNPPLAGQVAVITGAGRGIGRAIALTLAELGATPSYAGARAKPLNKPPPPSRSERPEFGKEFRDRMRCHRSAFGRSARRARRAHLPPPRHSRQQCRHRRRGRPSPSACARRLGPRAKHKPARRVLLHPQPGANHDQGSHGHIINISSLAGKNALPNGAAYAASKWGLNGLSYSVAEELRPHNIRVSVICPGSVHTEFSPHPGKNTEKMLQAADVAHVVAMLVTQAPQSFASEILLRPTQKP